MADDGPPGMRDWTGFLLYKCGWWVQRETDLAMKKLDLRDRHLMVLAILDADDTQSQQDLARHLGLDPTLVVALVDDLEDKGLCERARHPEDRRRHVLRLTAKGRKLYKEARALAVKVGDALFAPLDRAERAELTAMLRRVMRPLWGRPK